MTPAEQTTNLDNAQEIANAIEAFIADGNDFSDLGGYKDAGRGWFNYSNGSTYPTKIAHTLVDGGYLQPPTRPSNTTTT